MTTSSLARRQMLRLYLLTLISVRLRALSQSEKPVDDNRRDFRFVFLSFKFSVFLLHVNSQSKFHSGEAVEITIGSGRNLH